MTRSDLSFPRDLISRAVAAAREFGAITVGVPVKDTVKKVTAEGWVKKTVAREGLWLDADTAGLSQADHPVPHTRKPPRMDFTAPTTPLWWKEWGFPCG